MDTVRQVRGRPPRLGGGSGPSALGPARRDSPEGMRGRPPVPCRPRGHAADVAVRGLSACGASGAACWLV